jgi:hypothetical protein
MPLRIHRDKMFVSGEAWRLFKQAHPKQDFSDFGSKHRLSFLWDASIFLHFSCFIRMKVLHL